MLFFKIFFLNPKFNLEKRDIKGMTRGQAPLSLSRLDLFYSGKPRDDVHCNHIPGHISGLVFDNKHKPVLPGKPGARLPTEGSFLS